MLTPDEAEKVFYSLPFFAKPPSCKLLYSTLHDDRSEGDDKSTQGKSFKLNEMYVYECFISIPLLLYQCREVRVKGLIHFYHML